MKKHQEEYLKLLEDRFGVKAKPKIAYFSYEEIPDRGIIVELNPFNTIIFISDEPRSYYHKFSSELKSQHLPKCVWLTSKSDSDLRINNGFFI